MPKSKSQQPRAPSRFSVVKPRWRPDGWTIRGPRAFFTATGQEIPRRMWDAQKADAEKRSKMLNAALARGEARLIADYVYRDGS